MIAESGLGRHKGNSSLLKVEDIIIKEKTLRSLNCLKEDNLMIKTFSSQEYLNLLFAKKSESKCQASLQTFPSTHF